MANRLPPAQPSAFGGAVLSSYMYGYFLGLQGAMIAYLRHDMKPAGHQLFATALGLESTGWLIVWAIALHFVATLPVGAAARRYEQFTGRTYVADRIGFARAGGQDIGSLCGMLSVFLMIIVFATIVPSFLPAWLRIPALVILATWLGTRIAAALASRVFPTLFGQRLADEHQ